MRQKLKNKTPKKTASSKKSLLRSSANSDFPKLKLASLFFESGMGKEEWISGMKEHARFLSNSLLNDDIPQFEQYLNSGFSDLAINRTVKKRVDSSGMMAIDQKAFLQEFLQLAVLIEHSTIPPYLTAMYSIKEGTNPMATNIIRSVVVEEMLHMIMVCNVLNAIDIIPSVNKPQNFPSYPMKLPLNVDFYIGLEKFSSNSIATFIAIESPDDPMVKAPKFKSEIEDTSLLTAKSAREATEMWTSENLQQLLSENVNTIGEFYDLLFFFIVAFQCIEFYRREGRFPTSFEEINTGGLFTGAPDLQIGSEHYYGSGGKLIEVVDLQGVMHVFNEIKDQGEGAGDTIFADPNEFSEGVELAHYFRFKEIFHERFYVGGNYEPFTVDGKMPVITPPTGRAMKVDWDAAYPMMANVKMSDYVSNPALYAQGKAFNETYKKMLDCIQGAVEGRPEELSESVLYMYALKEQAIELMRQPLTSQENAGPTFEYPTN